MESIDHNEPADHITNNDPNENAQDNAQDNEEGFANVKEKKQVFVNHIPSINIIVTVDDLQLELTASSYQPGEVLGMIRQTLDMLKSEQLLGKRR